jgi:hypothetical protein
MTDTFFVAELKRIGDTHSARVYDVKMLIGITPSAQLLQSAIEEAEEDGFHGSRWGGAPGTLVVYTD